MLTDVARHPLNTIAPYYTMFRPEFPLSVLSAARGWVLDPFCGRGTTNFAARVLGLPSVGVDLSPVAVAIASAKMCYAEPNEVIGLALRLIERHPGRVPEGEFWELAFDRRTLCEICAVREGLLERDSGDPAATILRAVMLGALHGPRGKSVQSYLSNQMPRTYATKPAAALRYWRRNNLRPPYVSVAEVVQRRAARALERPLPRAEGCIVQGDSRKLALPASVGPIRHVVTSPPYYGMRAYVTDQWLRHWFLGGPEGPDYAANRQMDISTPAAYTADLARVWRGVAAHAASGCRLVVRFGAIPSAHCDPEPLLLESLALSDSGWVVMQVAPAGAANLGKRQARQFGCVRSQPIEEVDVHAVLGG